MTAGRTFVLPGRRASAARGGYGELIRLAAVAVLLWVVLAGSTTAAAGAPSGYSINLGESAACFDEPGEDGDAHGYAYDGGCNECEPTLGGSANPSDVPLSQLPTESRGQLVALGADLRPTHELNAPNSVPMYRGMKPTTDGLPQVGPTAKTLGARPETDIPVGSDGLVHPGTGGMSVNTSPTGMPEFRRPPAFGGSAKDVDMFCMQSCDLGAGLRFRPDPDVPGHGFVEPSWPMTIDDYQIALAGSQPRWGSVQS